MASSALFQALLLATSLGWNGVFAQDAYNNTSTTSSARIIVFAPQLGVSRTSLEVPAITTSSSSLSSSSSSSYSQPPIAYSPATGHTESSLDLPPTSSVSVTMAPYPVTQHSEGSLLVPTTTPSSRSSRTYRRPTVENPGTSLDVPTGSDASTPPIAYSPATGHSQTSLLVPTENPTGGLVATISLPPDHNGGYPVHGQDDDGRATNEVNPGGIIGSLIQEYSDQWNGGDQTTESPSQETPSSFPGTQIETGASAVTIDGTTYSLAPSGDGIYVNGQETTLTGPSATDSIALVVMSALGGGDRAPSDGESEGSSTLATSTSDVASSSQGSGSSSANPAQQTGNGAVLVLPGIGLGAVGLLMALL